MGRGRTAEHLAELEQRVADGIQRVAEQRARIARSGRRNHDAHEAKRLLAIFESLLAVHVANRNRLIAELGKTRTGRRKDPARRAEDHREELIRLPKNSSH